MTGKGRSDIWYHFEKKEKKAICRYCKGIISTSSGSTGNLRRHLKTKHPFMSLDREKQNERPASSQSRDSHEEIPIDIDDPSPSPSHSLPWTPGSGSESGTASAPSTPNRVLEFCVPSPSHSTTPPGSATPSLRPSLPQSSMSKYVDIVRPIPISRKRVIDVQLLKMICKEYYPFSIVEDKEFRKFIGLLNPNYTLPSRRTLSTSLLPVLHDEILEKVKKDVGDGDAICLTCDGWTNVNNVSFYALTAHYLDESTRLKSCLLECSEFPERHTSVNISTWIKEVLLKFSIRYKICALVTDNAANMKAAAVDLNLRHIPCYAHTLNLIVRDAIQRSIAELVEKAKAIVQFFKQSSSALAKLHEMQTSLKKDNLKLKQDVVTRWNSTYDMLERLLKNKEPVVSTLALLGSKDNLLLAEQEWVAIGHIVKLLSVFNSVTEEISSESNVSLSKTTILARIMTRKVNQYLDDNRNVPEIISKLGNDLLKNLADRFGNREENDLIAQCIILDPRFKSQGFGDELKYRTAYKRLATKLKFEIQQKKVLPSDPVPSSTTRNDDSSSIWGDFDDTMSLLHGKNDPQAEAIVELDKYLNEPYLPRVNDPLVWWESRKFTYPNLYSLMRRRLCILSTSTPCERLFSKAGQVCTEKRSRLTTDKIKMMLFIGHNINFM